MTHESVSPQVVASSTSSCSHQSLAPLIALPLVCYPPWRSTVWALDFRAWSHKGTRSGSHITQELSTVRANVYTYIFATCYFTTLLGGGFQKPLPSFSARKEALLYVRLITSKVACCIWIPRAFPGVNNTVCLPYTVFQSLGPFVST